MAGNITLNEDFCIITTYGVTSVTDMSTSDVSNLVESENWAPAEGSVLHTVSKVQIAALSKLRSEQLSVKHG